MDKITLIHGEGGRLTNNLIQNVIMKYFDNSYLNRGLDAAIINTHGKLAFTTDSFVVKPLFFKGGDIGKLAVSGTVNDLIAVGAKPLFLSCSLIIEDGFPMEKFIAIIKSMKETCELGNVSIVTGDTKVVSKKEADGLYINTSGIGVVQDEINYHLEPGDKIIVSGSLALHGTVILIDRYNLDVDMHISSDCYPLTYLLDTINKYRKQIKFMRDPTRGGLATVLNELSALHRTDINVFEDKVPFHKEVRGMNHLLGIDPLYLSSEGRMIFVVNHEIAKDFVCDLRKLENCHDAAIIGDVVKLNHDPKVTITSTIGGKRILSTLDDLILPRIC